MKIPFDKTKIFQFFKAYFPLENQNILNLHNKITKYMPRIPQPLSGENLITPIKIWIRAHERYAQNIHFMICKDILKSIHCA